ncbi:GyrI-like domain-containing protein [Glutamicibacter sp. AOP38-B1-38]|uniref:GyrI-like domain-containing protein n=1 Tax=Glutamicibacter sp. AOP38-B1-38 TaxID=3457680 RepID=UPI00403319AB
MSTPIILRNEAFTVLGCAVRTDEAGSARIIPDLWNRVYGERLLNNVPGRIDDDIYAVYTHLENSGRNRSGWFTFLIGVHADPSVTVPEGMSLVSVPASTRASFTVPAGDPTRVMEAWKQAWAYDDAYKTFLCEYERYGPSGASVNLGVHGDPASPANPGRETR